MTLSIEEAFQNDVEQNRAFPREVGKIAPDDEGAEQIVRRVHGVGRGMLATLLGRGFDVVATYAFYAIIARSVPVGDFGRLMFCFAALQMAASVARLGLDQALLATAAGGPAHRFGLQVVLAVTVIAAGTTVIACYIAGYPLPAWGLWLAAALPCVTAGQFIFGALRASGDVVIAALADTITQPAIAAAGALFVSVSAPSLSHFALAFTASWAITLLFALRVDWRGERLDRQASALFLRTGRSMLGVTIMHQAAASADILILGVAASPIEVGRYAVAHKIAAAFIVLHGALTTASAPFMRALADTRPLLARYYHTITRWMLTMSLPLVIVSVVAPGLLLAFFGHEYADASGTPLVLLSLAAIVFLVTGPAGAALLCTGHARQLFRVTAGGTLSLVIAVALLARYGAAGAAAGVLIGRLTARGLLIIAMRRYAKIDFADAPLLLIAATACTGVISAHLMAPWIGALPAAATGSALALMLAFIVLARSGDVAILRAEFRRI